MAGAAAARWLIGRKGAFSQRRGQLGDTTGAAASALHSALNMIPAHSNPKPQFESQATSRRSRRLFAQPWFRGSGLLILLAATTGCAPAGKGQSDAAPENRAPLRIDELAYYDALAQRRPDLLTDTKLLGTCYQALTLRPSLRARLLGGSETPHQIEVSLADPAEDAADSAWVEAQERAELALCASAFGGGCSRLCANPSGCPACPPGGVPNPGPGDGGSPPPFVVSGYPLCAYAGYSEGPLGPGFDWKLLFELNDYRNTLSPERFQEFSRQLAMAGYQGDAKTPLFPGWARFQYNTLIVHARTRADAAVAEQVAFRFFGAEILGYGRGTDVSRPSGGVDWHDFLCQSGADLSSLPADLQAFIHFAN
jgi:hypothetical protein